MMGSLYKPRFKRQGGAVYECPVWCRMTYFFPSFSAVIAVSALMR